MVQGINADQAVRAVVPGLRAGWLQTPRFCQGPKAAGIVLCPASCGKLWGDVCLCALCRLGWLALLALALAPAACSSRP